MTGRVRLMAAAIAALALAGCGGSSATPTPAPTPTAAPPTAAPTTVPTAAATVTITPPPASVAPGASTGTVSPLPSAPLSGGLEGPEWVMVRLSDGSVLNDVPHSIRASIRMTPNPAATPGRQGTPGIAAGDAGCNTFTTPYLVNGTDLAFPGDVVITTKTCNNPKATQLEQNYLQAFQWFGSYAVRDGALWFFQNSGAPAAVYIEAPSDPITGDWTVQSYKNGSGSILPVLPDAPVTVSFADDGSISGSTGCNQYTGRYKVNGQWLVISDITGGRVACTSQELSDQEVGFLDALQGSVLWTNQAGAMTFRDTNTIQSMSLAAGGA